jgi:hypothetical protein
MPTTPPTTIAIPKATPRMRRRLRVGFPLTEIVGMVKSRPVLYRMLAGAFE